jgi:hypothetical protein
MKMENLMLAIGLPKILLNKDRINIKGKWYVVEKPEGNVKFNTDVLTYFRGCVFETDSETGMEYNVSFYNFIF